MHESQLWMLVQDAAFAFCPTYDMAMRAVVKDAGLQYTWFPLYIARGLHPVPLTTTALAKVRPHYTEAQQQAALDALAAQGYLALRDGAYALTPTGSKAIERVFRIVHRELGKVKALPPRDMKRLADLLRLAVFHALHADLPAEKPALRCSRWTDTGEYSPAPISIEQYLTDLLRFRQDCLRQVRAAYPLNGPAWEVFTRIAEGSVSLNALRQAMTQRRHTPEVFSQAIQALIRHGWLAEGGQRGVYRLTEAGEQCHAEIERQTAALFAPVWAAFTPAERAELVELLARLKTSLESTSRRGRAARQA